MKARDVISPKSALTAEIPGLTVDAEMPLVELLPRLLDSPQRVAGVREGDRMLGLVDSTSILEGLNRFIAPRDDASVITLHTLPSAYSASGLAHAVEDSNTHLVDLWTAPDTDGRIKITLRVRTQDPSEVIENLQRYGYEVDSASGTTSRRAIVAAERLLALQAMFNV